MKLYLIEWRDSKSVQGWRHYEDINLEPLLCTTVGFVVAEDDKDITVGASFCEASEAYAEIVTIPKECIVKKKLIKY